MSLYPDPHYGYGETGRPVIAEASHVEAEKAAAAVDVPDGFLHVGWFCHHPLRKDEDGDWTREPFHRVRDRKKKRGWAYRKDTTSALMHGSHDYDFLDGAPVCPQAKPVFIRAEAV